MTLDQITRIWLSNMSPQTQYNYETWINKADDRAKELFGRPLVELTHPQLVSLMDYNSAKQGRHTQVTMVYVFRSFFRRLVKLGLRKDNPAEELRPPKYDDKLADRIITHEEVERIIQTAPAGRDRLMFKLLYVGALRVGELVHLKVKDLIVTPRQGKEMFTLRVWGKGQRTDYIVLPPSLGEEIRQYVRLCNPEAFIFSHSQGKGFTPGGVRQILRHIARKAGLPKVTPHYFRHAHATQALNRGADIMQVMKQLRHKSVTTTQRYVHMNPETTTADFLPPLSV